LRERSKHWDTSPSRDPTVDPARRPSSLTEAPDAGLSPVVDALNPLRHPICLAPTRRLTDVPFWQGHIPFARLVVDLLSPRLVVELGTYRGDSYCAFCQAVDELGLAARCFAIDTWEGDPHNDFYGAEVFQELRAYHDPLYGHFSTLVKGTFDDALRSFTDASIDLLHIDGYHTYEEVTHDFECWLPKLSQRAVVLLHDIRVRHRDYGVWKLWQELAPRFPSFEFTHDSGLGVLRIGAEASALDPLFRASPEEAADIRELFSSLGGHVGTADDRIARALLAHGEGLAGLARRDPHLQEAGHAAGDGEPPAREPGADLESELRRLRQSMRAREDEVAIYVASLRERADACEAEARTVRAGLEATNREAERYASSLRQHLESREGEARNLRVALETARRELTEARAELASALARAEDARAAAELGAKDADARVAVQESRRVAAEAELARIHASRWWRLADRYRQLRRLLGPRRRPR
jgi:hypothetical protein